MPEMSVSEAVKLLRSRTGLSQQAFAMELSIAIRSVANYERGGNPSNRAMESLVALAVKSGEREIAESLRSALEQRIQVRASNTNASIASLAKEFSSVLAQRDRYKECLDRIAQAVYPHKQDRFTYSVNFIVAEIKQLIAARADLHRLDWLDERARVYGHIDFGHYESARAAIDADMNAEKEVACQK